MKRFALVVGLVFATMASAEEATAATSVEEYGKGISLTADIGMLGGLQGSSISLKIPLVSDKTGGVSLRLRQAVLLTGADTSTRVLMGPRLEVVFQSPVLANLLRLYGAPAVMYTWNPTGTKVSSWSGGGNFGCEIFVSPKRSFYFEIGSGSPSIPSVTAGFSSVAGYQTFF